MIANSPKKEATHEECITRKKRDRPVIGPVFCESILDLFLAIMFRSAHEANLQAAC